MGVHLHSHLLQEIKKDTLTLRKGQDPLDLTHITAGLTYNHILEAFYSHQGPGGSEDCTVHHSIVSLEF